MTGFELERFVTAQDRGGTYEQALAELRHGRKTGHWMWFVFPQVAGLGQSPTSRQFAIASRAEGQAYLDHPVLGSRLRECATVVAATAGRTSEEIFGGIDAQKLRSSMTLFARVAPTEAVFQRVLDRFFDGQPDSLTDRLLSGASN